MYEHHKDIRGKITRFVDPWMGKCFFCCWITDNHSVLYSNTRKEIAAELETETRTQSIGNSSDAIQTQIHGPNNTATKSKSSHESNEIELHTQK